MQVTASEPAKRATRSRDVRLDFFRGLGMFIILIAHITDNPWTLYIPARFGFSDATEMFVFCSGMASAIAFGAVFAKAGFWIGCFRVAHRIWQVYWVHIGTFLITVMMMLLINKTGLAGRDEVSALNLHPFLRPHGNNIIGLFTLTYVPNYFDILPMYLVILALLPVVYALSRVHVHLALAFCLALWAIATFTTFNLPAEFWFANDSRRQWFFNPFAWQLIFFTGFAFMSGWLPKPPVTRGLLLAAGSVVLITIPFAWHVIIAESAWIKAWRGAWRILYDKTDFGILRYVHFLALAYLAWAAVGPGGERLTSTPAMRALTAIFTRVGRQSLAVFAASIVLARVLGALLLALGGGAGPAFMVNTLGFLVIYLVAWFTDFAKSEPWRKQSSAGTSESPGNDAQTPERPKLVVVNQ
ncbi:OpgC family protein [Aestuariivirga sp.]|uniref:OpgC family protein n=1 Tax=Aestuariivirga sp. TaxID=2650926 RepID=UPI00359421F9